MLRLRHGRTLDVDARAADEVVEIRNAAGVVELRVRLTEEGVILQLEGSRISLRATESVDVECNTFSLRADRDVQIQGALIRLN